MISSRTFPLGATILDGGVNFSLFSRTATAVELLLFDRLDPGTPQLVVKLDPADNRTYHYWHTFVPGIGPGQLYGFRVDGPNEPPRGGRFDREKLLIDPYGRGVYFPENYSREDACKPGANLATALKSVVVDPSTYDWEGDRPLRNPHARTIIYELHVRGFTKHPNSDVDPLRRGTFAGVIDKIPYLKSLGITAVELMPIFAFDPQAAPAGRTNYWGYQPVSFFAPHPTYAVTPGPLGVIDEFREMVKALHRAGIEVILDVVFNHTAEGGDGGPWQSLRGIDDFSYYLHDSSGQRYTDFSGCGNTLNANHPIVRRMILDSLRYWVQEMHVDGFRFDLASILARDSQGRVLPNPPVLWDIESDPVLAGTKLIAETWDASGLYQVGSFVGDAWKEWNGRFRDDTRDFFRGVPGAMARFADRFVGSHDVYGHEGREVEQSINFVTCHDGFTLNDLVSYNQKHNEANGEENRDGCDDNRSWNCGVEGPSDNPMIEALRNRQVKNFLTVTLMSLGVPMILMGDEVRRTQKGNNNAYCQDNELSWFDWSLLEKHADVRRFLSLLTSRRLLRTTELERRRASLSELISLAQFEWHGPRLNQPDWGLDARSFAITVQLGVEQIVLHMMFSASSQAMTFELPRARAEGSCWRRWIDTALPAPHDIVEWADAKTIPNGSYEVQPHSVVLLLSHLPGGCPIEVQDEQQL